VGDISFEETMRDGQDASDLSNLKGDYESNNLSIASRIQVGDVYSIIPFPTNRTLTTCSIVVARSLLAYLVLPSQ
jgi:hypothetical protein